MQLTPPCFVLIRPQLGENIGASARAMWNFGLDQMRLVAPRDGWPNAKASALACGAGRLLDHAQVVTSTVEAIADCHFTFATTARPRANKLPTYAPQAAMQEAAQRSERGERVAILFGPERNGLENLDIDRASAIISIPTNSACPSINLSHAVLLLAYEWYQESKNGKSEIAQSSATDSATVREREVLAQHYEKCLEEADFFFPPEKAASMKATLRGLWSRLPLLTKDVDIFHGILRQLTRQNRQASHINRKPIKSLTSTLGEENDQ